MRKTQPITIKTAHDRLLQWLRDKQQHYNIKGTGSEVGHPSESSLQVRSAHRNQLSQEIIMTIFV